MIQGNIYFKEMYNPIVSVLLPVYNYNDILPVLDSILNQTYSDFELLICDDGSNPKLVWPELDDQRVRFFSNKNNIGLGGTLNRLLSKSSLSCKYFSTIEQDDIYKPFFLEKCISFLEKEKNFGLVSGISEFWDGNKVSYKFPGSHENVKI